MYNEAVQDLWMYFAPMIIFGVPWAAWAYISSLRIRERTRAREALVKLLDRRLDLIQSAITMGMPNEEIAALDERLERLIGSDNFADIAGLKSADLAVPGLGRGNRSKGAQL